MASRADNIASTLSLANFSKATELKKRIWFTVGALIVFRFLSFVPLPGVNPLVLQSLYEQTRGGILDMFNAFSGGGHAATKSVSPGPDSSTRTPTSSVVCSKRITEATTSLGHAYPVEQRPLSPNTTRNTASTTTRQLQLGGNDE